MRTTFNTYIGTRVLLCRSRSNWAVTERTAGSCYYQALSQNHAQPLCATDHINPSRHIARADAGGHGQQVLHNLGRMMLSSEIQITCLWAPRPSSTPGASDWSVNGSSPSTCNATVALFPAMAHVAEGACHSRKTLSVCRRLLRVRPPDLLLPIRICVVLARERIRFRIRFRTRNREFRRRRRKYHNIILPALSSCTKCVCVASTYSTHTRARQRGRHRRRRVALCHEVVDVRS